MDGHRISGLALVVGVGVVAVVLWMGRHRSESVSDQAVDSAPAADVTRGELSHLASRGEPEGVARSESRSGLMSSRLREPGPASAIFEPRRGPADDSPEADDNPELETVKQTALTDIDPEERAAAVRMLSNVTNDSVVPILIQALADRDAEVRLDALHELAWSPDVAGVHAGALAPSVRDPSPDVRVAALHLLGELNDPEAVRLIRTALNDRDEDVRAVAESLLDDPK